MKIPFEIFISTLFSECYARRNTIIAIFAVVSLLMLATGYYLPKKYQAFTIVHVDEVNILQSLMEGAAEATQPGDYAANAVEIIFGDKIMDSVLADANFIDEDASELGIEILKQQIRKRTSIRSVGDNLLRIEYQDNDPERTYITAKRMTELFIEEGEKSKRMESQNAFNFIDKQVNKYLIKLTKVEEELRSFHSNNLDSRPGLEAAISQKINTLQSKLEQAHLDLREAQTRKKSFKEQLYGEAAISINQSKEGQYKSKIMTLQDEMERLLLDYQDTYPDIVRLKHQINDLKEAMANEIKQRKQADSIEKKPSESYVDKAITTNPLYLELRSNAASTDTEIATLKARIKEMNKNLDNAYEQAKKIFGGETTLARLTRDYQVNQEIYQDLLRRRESARVSKSLDQDQQGLTFSIQEPARVPIIPTGIRFIHFAMAGILLGVAIPIALVWMLLLYDPRVRFSEIIINDLNIPVVAEISKITTEYEHLQERKDIMMIGLGLLGIFIVYGLVGWFKLTGMFQ